MRAALQGAALLFALLPGFSPRAAEAPDCGTIVIPDGIGQSDPSAVTGLNPLLSQSLYNTQARLLLYRPLVWPSQADTFDPDRSLADHIDVSADNTVFTVTLKPWLWSDGVKVTADDVLFCWELIGKLGGIFAFAGQGGVPDRIASVTVLNPSQIAIKTTTSVNPEWFELNGISNIFALPRHAWGNVSKDELWRRQTDPGFFKVVDGPFQLIEFRLDRYIALTPNPLYGGHKSTLRRLVIDFLEGSSALHALQAGEIDMAHVPFSLWDRVKNTPGYHFVTLPQSFGYRSVVLNVSNPHDIFLRDVRVRQALTDATDQKTMINLVYHGFSHESRTPIPVDPDTYVSPEVKAGLVPVHYDPSLAAKLLDGAGWMPGADGIRQKNGVRMSFSIVVSVEAPDRVQELQILQQNLRAVGIDLKLQIVTFGQLLSTMYGPKDGWDAILLSWTLAGLPDGTTYFDTGGSNNVGGYSDAKMDQLIKDTVTKPGRAALFAYENYMAAQQPWNFLPEGAYPLMVAPDIGGVSEFTNSQGYWSPEYLTVTGARACDAAPHS